MSESRPDSKSVTRIATAEAEKGRQHELLALVTGRAHFVVRQPALVSINLHRSLGGKRIAYSGPAANS